MKPDTRAFLKDLGWSVALGLMASAGFMVVFALILALQYGVTMLFGS